MKKKNIMTAQVPQVADDSDSDKEVNEFTRLFMSRADLKAATSVIESEAPVSEDDNQMSSNYESEEDAFEVKRARNRMSPSEESEDSDDEAKRASKRMSPTEESEDSDEEANRAGNRWSPSPDSDDSHEGGISEKQSPPKKCKQKGSKIDRNCNTDTDNSDYIDLSKEGKSVAMRSKEDTSSVEGSDSEDDEEESPEEAVEDAKSLHEGLADVPFEDLQKLKEKIGVKAFNSAMGGNQRGAPRRSLKRVNKNRPMEMSSKKPVSRLRDIVQVKKKVSRDPRFDETSGEFHEHFFTTAYSFISDIQTREKEKLKKRMKKETDEDKKTQIKYLVARMTQQEKAAKDKELRQKRDREIKKKELGLVQDGKVPFHLKKSDRKTLELAEKFRELKKRGKVDKYMAKKRKKNAQKEKRKLPPKQP